jgi:hypothetical protein
MSKQMSKQQGGRYLTRQARRREEQRLREEQQRRAMRARRIKTAGIIAIIALAAIGIIYFVITQSQAPANAAYPTVDGISCDQLEHSDFHIHAHVSVYINGQPSSVPAQIGIAPDGSCLYWLHTHTSDGIIHIEAPAGHSFTLGNFLDIWGKHFPQLGYPAELDQASGWQVYVDGKPYSGNLRSIPLQSHTLITLAYNSPGVKPDTNFDWNGL